MNAAHADIHFDPTTLEMVRDPYLAYEKLRRDAPVHWNPKGFWFVSRFKDVQFCLGDARLSNQPAPFALVHARNQDRFVAANVANNLIAFQDAPGHAPLRSWVARCFANRIRGQDEMLAGLARTCVTDLPPDGRFDAVADFAIPFASQAICAIMGFPKKDAARIADWSMDFFSLFHAIPDKSGFDQLNSNLKSFRDYVLARMEDTSATQGQGLIAELIATAPHDTTRVMIADNIMLLLADGVGNVQSGLTNCLAVLLQMPDLPEQLFGTPKDRGRLVDECLRLESPGQYQGRIAREDIEVAGAKIRAHSIVLLGLASANRDPDVFHAPDAFDPLRLRPQHLAFGHGAHMCMGNVLVRKEIGAALYSLFSDRQALRAVAGQLDWLARPGHRWLRSLMIECDAV